MIGAVINAISTSDDHLIAGGVSESKTRTKLAVVSIGKSILSSPALSLTEDDKSTRTSSAPGLGNVGSSPDIRLATSCGGVEMSRRNPNIESQL